jgi:hypothetical protein
VLNRHSDLPTMSVLLESQYPQLSFFTGNACVNVQLLQCAFGRLFFELHFYYYTTINIEIRGNIDKCFEITSSRSILPLALAPGNQQH